jgi:phosphoglycolate phosphatase
MGKETAPLFVLYHPAVSPERTPEPPHERSYPREVSCRPGPPSRRPQSFVVQWAVHLIVFDLDGTLVDSSLDLANSTNEMLESYGASPLPVDVVTSMVGEGAQRLVERALAASRLDAALPDALARFRAIYDRRLLEHTRPYDGIPDVVCVASQHARLGVLTNKPEGPTRRLLDGFGWASTFAWVIGGDSGFPRKPDPAAMRHLRAEGSASAAETLFVGDSMIDVETARRAGVKICVARYGFGHLRGALVLRGDEIIAMRPAEVGTAIEQFFKAREDGS